MIDKECRECKVNAYCGTNLSCEKAKEIYNKAFIDLLRKICFGCADLEGTKCNNPSGCPCVINQRHIVEVINKLVGGKNDND